MTRQHQNDSSKSIRLDVACGAIPAFFFTLVLSIMAWSWADGAHWADGSRIGLDGIWPYLIVLIVVGTTIGGYLGWRSQQRWERNRLQ